MFRSTPASRLRSRDRAAALGRLQNKAAALKVKAAALKNHKAAPYVAFVLFVAFLYGGMWLVSQIQV